jgi:hypothetical protein
MASDASSLLFDASAFYDSPELSDVTIVLIEESDDVAERALKRQRTGDGADGAQMQQLLQHLQCACMAISSCSAPAAVLSKPA